MSPPAHPITEATYDRRTILGMLAGALSGIAAAPPAPSGQRAESKISVVGVEDPNLEPLDKFMLSFLKDHKVPGASLAVTRKGKLVYARGFGPVTTDSKETVRPESLFRIASVSKPITAV